MGFTSRYIDQLPLSQSCFYRNVVIRGQDTEAAICDPGWCKVNHVKITKPRDVRKLDISSVFDFKFENIFFFFHGTNTGKLNIRERSEVIIL